MSHLLQHAVCFCSVPRICPTLGDMSPPPAAPLQPSWALGDDKAQAAAVAKALDAAMPGAAKKAAALVKEAA